MISFDTFLLEQRELNRKAKLLVLQYGNSTKEHIKKYLDTYQQPYSRTMLAHYVPKSHEMLLKDRSSRVKMKIAQVTNNQDHLNTLVKNNPKNHSIREYYIQKTTNKEMLDKHVNSNSYDDRYLVSSNKNLSKEHIDKLISDPRASVRENIARRPNLTKEHFDKLVGDEDSYVRANVARSSPHKEHNDILKNDSLEYIRKYANDRDPNSLK